MIVYLWLEESNDFLLSENNDFLVFEYVITEDNITILDEREKTITLTERIKVFSTEERNKNTEVLSEENTIDVKAQDRVDVV